MTSNGFYLCRCTVCHREHRTGLTPLRDGWPKCCGYTMRLVESERFIASVDRQVGAAMNAASVFASDPGSGASGVGNEPETGAA